ncbi:hypothetical protein [Thermomonas sp.]|uniref:hypothetical protein n=1 Tax=Thermomonas sp. TaxID=1971895 RepID=UPI0035AF5812
MYATLIAAGYGKTPDDIGRYTQRQLHLFYREEEARERRKRRGRLHDNNAAFVGGSAAKKQAKALED